MTKKQTKIITILSLAAFILALFVSGRYWLRIDLTRDRSHTISQVTRNLYREIPDPVNITFYLSSRLRTVDSAPGEIEDLLREIAAHSRGRIRLSVRDPLRVGLNHVNNLGLEPRQLPVVEQDQTSIITVYSGIVLEYLDRIEVIPWVFSTATLEYDITFRIRSMVSDIDRWVAIMVADSFRQWEEFGFLNRLLHEAGYTVRLIAPGEAIPDDAPGLIVLGGGAELDDWDLYRIDRYIQLGGRVLFAVDGVFVDTIQGTLEVVHFPNPALLDMLASYGVIVRPELVLDRFALMIQFQSRSPFGGMMWRIARYPLWIGVPGELGNPQHPITSNFNGIDLYWASPLELFHVDGVEPAVLFTSSPQAWLMRDAFHTNPEFPHMMEMEAAQTQGIQILGASLTGVFPSFFYGAPKPEREWSDEELPDMPEFASPARIIVVGDTDFASNMMSVSNAEQNLDFLLSAVDWLTSDDDIIAIRNRQPRTGRFDRIADEDQRTAVMRFVQVLNVGLVPLLVIAAGLIRGSRRSRAMRLSLPSQDADSNKQKGEQE